MKRPRRKKKVWREPEWPRFALKAGSCFPEANEPVIDLVGRRGEHIPYLWIGNSKSPEYCYGTMDRKAALKMAHKIIGRFKSLPATPEVRE